MWTACWKKLKGLRRPSEDGELSGWSGKSDRTPKFDFDRMSDKKITSIRHRLWRSAGKEKQLKNNKWWRGDRTSQKFLQLRGVLSHHTQNTTMKWQRHQSTMETKTKDALTSFINRYIHDVIMISSVEANFILCRFVERVSTQTVHFLTTVICF